MGFSPFAGPGLLQRQAATPAAGIALQNGTPILATWTTPNDGNLHRAVVMFTLAVSVTEVGGAIALLSHFNGALTINATIFAGSQAGPATYTFPATAAFGATLSAFLLGPGDTITLQQGTALTGGAAVAYAEIWGS